MNVLLTKSLAFLMIALIAAQLAAPVGAQTADLTHDHRIDYVDQTRGRSADDFVALALEKNGDLAAMRKEADAAEAMIRQAGLRPNPSVAVNGTRQISGTDNSWMVEGSLPLEIYGRRGARLRVAAREAEIRRAAVSEKERLLAAEVREKFGQALALALKLAFTRDLVEEGSRNLNLVAAIVREGRKAPLEENLEIVELNRMRAMYEMAKGRTEIALLELRNLAGLDPTEPILLRGNFDNLLFDLKPEDVAVAEALRLRPDLGGARLIESLAEARIEQARVESKPDAEVMAGYQRMRTGFPLQGVVDGGALRPIESTMNFFTFGVRITLPVRNRNQGMIEAFTAEREAARRRREFGELAVKNDVATAYVMYRSAARAMEIYRVGVRNQATANLSVVRQSYELGSKTLLDYIAEHHRFIEIENGYIDACLETYLARIAIMKAVNEEALTKK